ncbi:MAG: threonine synthase [Chitinophagaceae bacterium]
MQFYSTNNKSRCVSLNQAIFQSLPEDNGLYMPDFIPKFDNKFIQSLDSLSFQEIAYEVSRQLLHGEIEDTALKNIVEEAINFPAPVIALEKNVYVLELFHGPSMAFKDFGARFMSRAMEYFLKKGKRKLNILVATSGDTGGAVAMGFYDVPDIQVTILYPSGKVSPVQEQQLTTLGKNITALEIKGTFDDCQRLVKQAFLDKDLNRQLNLSSANSINIARLIPQTFYYFNAVAQIRSKGDKRPIVFSVPSGNFGNITAGLISQRMGMPVHHFVASTNINDEVPQYLQSGKFIPYPSKHTLSNAMDVGNPSNFSRMLDLFDKDVDKMASVISGYSFDDEETKAGIRHVFDQHKYVMCPHTSVAYLGLKEYLKEYPDKDLAGVFLSTAHPCKFPDVFEEDIKKQIVYPSQVAMLKDKKKNAVLMDNDFEALKVFLLK